MVTYRFGYILVFEILMKWNARNPVCYRIVFNTKMVFTKRDFIFQLRYRTGIMVLMRLYCSAVIIWFDLVIPRVSGKQITRSFQLKTEIIGFSKQAEPLSRYYLSVYVNHPIINEKSKFPFQNHRTIINKFEIKLPIYLAINFAKLRARKNELPGIRIE